MSPFYLDFIFSKTYFINTKLNQKVLEIFPASIFAFYILRKAFKNECFCAVCLEGSSIISWLFSRSSSSFFSCTSKLPFSTLTAVACPIACSALVSMAFSLPSIVLSLSDTHASFSSVDFVLVSTSPSLL